MSFTINFLNKNQTFENKVKLLDLIDDDKKQYVCAQVNKRMRELTYEVYYDANVKFLTTKDRNSIKIYESSLRFILCMALENLFPGKEYLFLNSISRSLFVRFLHDDTPISDETVELIKQEMQRIIDADYPLVRTKVTKEEAAELYKANNQFDKIDILKYRPEKMVHIYDCNGYKNYMYSHMVPSTGYIQKFNIIKYHPGLIVQYPRSETNGEIPEFVDSPVFRKTLRAASLWGKITSSDTVSKINEKILNDGIVDFIQLSEAGHNKMLAELGSIIESRKDEIRLICIAGPSSSGKTTFANRLRVELLSRGLEPIRISLDDYYLPHDKTPKDENGNYDFESIYALDIDLINENLSDLINGKEVQLPHFDFKIGKRVPGRLLKVNENEPIIIEGIHALNELLTSQIAHNHKYKIFIAPQAQINLDNANPLSLTDLRLLRRLVRDHKYRNSSAEDTLSMWDNVRKGEFKWIYDTQENADYVYNSLLSYELCVMRKYALPLLNKIDKENEYFPLAERLIRLLKYFVDMPDDWIPCNSLIREFIGGSCYAECDK